MTLARLANGRINRAKAPYVAKNCRLTDSDFVVYAARTLYAAGYWMSTPNGERCMGDPLDCAPITPKWAYDLARDLESCIQMANLGRTLENVMDEWRAFDDAAQVIGYQPLSSNGQGVDVMAHYAACEYLGIGVGLSDIHGFPREAFPWRGEAYEGARLAVPTVGANDLQRLYVIRGSYGVSCLGFDVAAERTARYVEWLRARGVTITGELAPAGSIALYDQYGATLSRIKTYLDHFGGRCDADLSPQLIGLEGKRVRAVTTCGETRTFTVGRSTGWLPIHLEVKPKDVGGLSADRVYASVTVIR